MMKRSLFALSVFALLPFGAIACEPDESPPSISNISGGPSRKVPVPPSASFPPPVDNLSCPDYARPENGTSCNAISSTGSEASCEYGHDTNKFCNDIYDCKSGRWSRRSPPRCIDRCPQTFFEIEPGTQCAPRYENGDADGLGCSYFEGTCGCVPDQGNSLNGHWKCAQPPANGCPRQKPPLGQDCVREMVCDYGTCEIGFNLTYSCYAGLWRQTDTKACE